VVRDLPAGERGARRCPGPQAALHHDRVTLVRDKEVTRDIYRRFEGKLALNCFVIEAGDLAVGDEVRLVRGRGCGDAATAAIS
jgi:hypothetical protein